MSDNKNTDEWIYKEIIIYKVPEGKYNLFNGRGCSYRIVPIDKSKKIEYYFNEDHDIHKDIQNFEEKYNIYIPDNIEGEEIKLKYNSTWRYKFICEINNGHREVFIEVPIDEKNNKKYPLYTAYQEHNLIPHKKYIINNFIKLKYEYGIIKSDIIYLHHCCKDIDQYYSYPEQLGHREFCVSKKVMNILETYFKCEKDKIYCVYNNKKEFAKLTLITEDEIITEDGGTKILQSLLLEIGDKKFTFYINNPNVINYKKEGKYCFLIMHIDNNLLYNNLIYGYEFKENKYYYLKYEEKIILKNIDNEIANNFKMLKNQNLYTYLLSNNEKCGMVINIDKDNNVTHKLVKLNNKCFESLLDISLLKPVCEWDNNDYCEIDKFDGIIEGFD